MEQYRESIEKVARRKALKRWCYDIIPTQFNDEPNLQNVFTPFSLCSQIIYNYSEFDLLIDKTFLVFNIEFIEVLSNIGLSHESITFISDSELKIKYVNKQYVGVHTMKYDSTNVTSKECNEFNELPKFDVVIMNPPYQTKSDSSHKTTQAIWPLFVEKALDLLKEDGYLCAVHPSGWRGIDGRYKKLQEKMKTYSMKYLEIHDTKEGLKTFGAVTRYDWYVLQKNTNPTITKIRWQDDTIEEHDIKKLEFIPNAMFSELLDIVAKNGEEKVEVLYSCAYHAQKRDIVSKDQTEKFKYPCVRSVNVKNVPNMLKYSKTNKNGHFGIPKVIFTRLGEGVMIDFSGEYGMCEDCSGIIDDVDVLPQIHKAMKSKKFINLMKSFNVGGQAGNIYDRKIISLFRKDFWKEFI